MASLHDNSFLIWSLWAHTYTSKLAFRTVNNSFEAALSFPGHLDKPLLLLGALSSLMILMVLLKVLTDLGGNAGGNSGNYYHNGCLFLCEHWEHKQLGQKRVYFSLQL